MSRKEAVLLQDKENFEKSATATMKYYLLREEKAVDGLKFIQNNIADIETATEETHQIDISGCHSIRSNGESVPHLVKKRG